MKVEIPAENTVKPATGKAQEEKSLKEIEQHAIEDIIKAMNDDSLIIFVGAGASVDSGLPDWNGLIRQLREELSIGESEKDPLKIAQYYYDHWGQQKYVQKISDMFEPFAGSQPNEIHKHIFRIQPRHLITTNYDSLLEDKMNSGIAKYEVVKKDSDIPYSRSSHYLIKMHGDLAEKNIVLKEDDYLDYETNFRMVSTLIKSLIMNNTVLFIGYSLNDSTFNHIFRQIQTGFGLDAKKAYFFTPEKPGASVIKYYDKKGLHVLSGGSASAEHEPLGKLTVDFLARIAEKTHRETTTADDLWDDIRFLDHLPFVESRHVVNSTHLSKDALLFSQNSYEWRDSKTPKFTITEKSEVHDFLRNKTWFNNFLGLNIDPAEDVKPNPILSPAFELYTDRKYGEAKIKFEEIANDAFNRKDYWNFLVAWFNARNILTWFGDNIKISDSIYAGTDFDKMVDRIIESVRGDTKRLAIFFRDEIQSFKFLYLKLCRMDRLLNELRKERENFKNGGSSVNSNLCSLRYEYRSFVNFIEKNCLCVYQYNEYKMVVHRYFESLVVASDNSHYEPQKGSMFNGTSSVIQAIRKEDIEHVIPHLDEKMLRVFSEDYSFSEIKVTEDCFGFIANKILELCFMDKDTSAIDGGRPLKRYIDFLSFIDIHDPNMLVNILDKYPISPPDDRMMIKILKLLLNNRESLSEDSIEKLLVIAKKNIALIAKKPQKWDNYSFGYYAALLKFISDSGRDTVLCFDDVSDKLFLIEKGKHPVTGIINFQEFLLTFYRYLDSGIQKQVQSILEKYERLPEEDIKIPFVISMILSDIYPFEKLTETVFNKTIANIDAVQRQDFKVLPDPQQMAVADLFNLHQHGYFSSEHIEKANLDDAKMKGKFPEIDWVLFNIRTDKVISDLVNLGSFSAVKETFGKNEDDRKTLDAWAVKQFETDTGQFKK